MGVITKAILRLIPLPEKTVTVAAIFTSIHNAIAAIDHIIISGIRPSVIEFMDKASISVVRDLLPESVREKGEAMVISEVDGPEAHGRGRLADDREDMPKGWSYHYFNS